MHFFTTLISSRTKRKIDARGKKLIYGKQFQFTALSTIFEGVNCLARKLTGIYIQKSVTKHKLYKMFHFTVNVDTAFRCRQVCLHNAICIITWRKQWLRTTTSHLLLLLHKRITLNTECQNSSEAHIGFNIFATLLLH